MPARNKITIKGLNIDVINYNDLVHRIQSAISENSKLTVTYANANTINRIYADESLRSIVERFDVVHPDGIGIYFASKLLFDKTGLTSRFTGSDFYPHLTNELIRCNFSISFYGDKLADLELIKNRHPGLDIRKIVPSLPETFKEMHDTLLNSSGDVLVVGLGFPKQEKWILENKEKLNYKVIIAVGDGIKIFAGTKRRGPEFLRTFGLEWLTRLLLNPLRYFNRYVIGNPLFLCRIIMLKMRNLRS